MRLSGKIDFRSTDCCAAAGRMSRSPLPPWDGGAGRITRARRCMNIRIIIVMAAALAVAPDADAQAWPAKPVRIVMPFAPGGGADIMGRMFARRFTETLGQTFIAENRPGAGGLIGAEIVAKSPPDGYNILVTTASISVNVSLH